MSTFRQDPEDRDSARVAGDIRTLRQRISAGPPKRRPAAQMEQLDGPVIPAEDAPALLDDRELVSH